MLLLAEALLQVVLSCDPQEGRILENPCQEVTNIITHPGMAVILAITKVFTDHVSYYLILVKTRPHCIPRFFQESSTQLCILAVLTGLAYQVVSLLCQTWL